MFEIEMTRREKTGLLVALMLGLILLALCLVIYKPLGWLSEGLDHLDEMIEGTAYGRILKKLDN